MKTKWLAIPCLMAMGVALVGCQSKTPATNKTMKSTATPRIVSTTVAATTIFDKLNLDLVGIPTSSQTLPTRYQSVTKVGSPMGPDMEKLSLLKPDRVYSTKTLESDLAPQFANAGLKADFLDFTSISSMMAEITSLGKTYQRSTEAQALNQTLMTALDQAKQKAKTEKPVKVLILMGIPGSYLVATEHSYIGNLVKLVGGTNVVQGEHAEYLASNTEYLQKSNPDIILRAAHGMPEEVVKMYQKDFKENPIWQTFSAVKNQRVYDLDSTLFGMTATLDAPKALKETEKMLYENH